ncbi:hypothetical protein HKX48_007800 [Thoreauomyces humboldtii]|nr:hypothetical protein HKX48_007800 [Thoreauomyces humboldtii]
MIAAASGWDIKLRELVMKEAKQAEPSSSNTTPLVSPRPSLDRPRSSSVVRPVSRSDEADVVEAPQITPVSSPRRRATLVSRFSASAPTLNRRGSKIPQPTPSTNIPETDGTPATPGGNGLLDRRPPAGPAAQVARGERLQRRASDYSTIIGAYDERLREIVLEAAGGLETRLRNRNTVATDNGAESTGDVSSSESSSSARDSFRRSLPPAADMRRRRTMSFSNMNPMARSDAEERDHFTPTPRTRTAPTTPSRKSTILRRQTFQHSQTTADRPLQSAALEAKTDSGSADPLPSMIKVDPLPDSRQTRRWATLLEPNKGDLSTGVPVPSTARNITIVPSTGYITTLLSTPASPTSAPSNSHRLPIPPKQPDQAAGDRLSPPSPATPPRPQETTPAVASTLPSQSFSVFKDPGHHDRDSAVSLSAESNGGPSPSPDPHPPSPPFPPQKAEIGMYIRYL